MAKYLIFAAFLLMSSGCINSGEIQDGGVPVDSCIFIEEHIEVNMEALEENCSKNLNIDFQGYEFDPEKGTLRGNIHFDINKTAVIYGNWLSLRGDTGRVEMKRLVGVSGREYKEGSIKIKEVGHEGTVTLDYEGKEITLRPDEDWETVSEKIIEGEMCDLKQITITRITNYGVLKKSQIQSR